MKSKDQQLLEEAYGMVNKPKPKLWDWDQEITVDGVPYYTQANYTTESYEERDTNYHEVTVTLQEVEVYDAETNQPITEESNPELYNKIVQALELAIQEDITR